MLTCWHFILLSLMGMCFPEKVLEKAKLINHQRYIICFKGGTNVCAKPSDTWCQTNFLVVPEEKSGDRQSLQDSSSTAQFVKKSDLSLSHIYRDVSVWYKYWINRPTDQSNILIRKKHYTGRLLKQIFYDPCLPSFFETATSSCCSHYYSSKGGSQVIFRQNAPRTESRGHCLCPGWNQKSTIIKSNSYFNFCTLWHGAYIT